MRIVERLAEDHANARRLATGIADLAGIAIDPAEVETNLVYFDVASSGLSAAKFAEALLAERVRMTPMGASRVRAVTHLDVVEAMMDRAIAAIGRVARHLA